MSDPSPGRRILAAVVTGEAGARIQAWRQVHDPAQARRLPPHLTLCPWMPQVDLAMIEAQVRHAFPRPIQVRLGGVRELANRDHTFYVEVLETAELDLARRLLEDGTYLELPVIADWTWHVTCVRRGRSADLDRLRAAAVPLSFDLLWTIDIVAAMELRRDRYETVGRWQLFQK